jgi:hypothetical protein
MMGLAGEKGEQEEEDYVTYGPFPAQVLLLHSQRDLNKEFVLGLI